jgi:chloride channel 2
MIYKPYSRVAPDDIGVDGFIKGQKIPGLDMWDSIGDNLDTTLKKSYHWGHGSTTFLIALGLLTSLIAWCMDEGAMLISYYCWLITDSFGGCCNAGESWCFYGTVTCPNTSARWDDNVPRYFIYVGLKLIIVTMAVVITHYVGPLAKGSGIPEMRTIIGGFDWGIEGGYLSVRTLVAKVVGLTLCLGGGLDVGKEGPFVHTSCVIAYQMLQLRRFKPLQSSNELSNHILSAAVAVGVAATFGAPIGGVLFSIEVTAVFYKSTNYWKAFLCAICGCLAFKALGFVASDRDSQVALLETRFDPLPYHWWELPVFVLIGALCGVLGGLFTKLFAFSGKVQGRHGDLWRGISAIIAALIFALVEFPMGGYMTMSLTKSMGDLFHEVS